MELTVTLSWIRRRRGWRASCPALEVTAYGDTAEEALATLGRRLSQEMERSWVAEWKNRQKGEKDKEGG